MAREIKERRWLAYPHEVQAILDRRQRMFRRVMKPQPRLKSGPVFHEWTRGQFGCGYLRFFTLDRLGREWDSFTCPYGGPGDRLWVQESFVSRMADPSMPEVTKVWYRASDERLPAHCPHWRSSMHMPRGASRITLEITAARAERVQEISVQDCLAEGIAGENEDLGGFDEGLAFFEFMQLWDSLNAEPKASKRNPYTGLPEKCYVSYPWEDVREKQTKASLPWYIVGNPWVWPVEFRVLNV